MTTEWPRPQYPGDYLTGAYLSLSYGSVGHVIGDVPGEYVPVTLLTLEGLSIVPGTFYSIDLRNPLDFVLTVAPTATTYPLQGYIYVEMDLYDASSVLLGVTQVGMLTTTTMTNAAMPLRYTTPGMLSGFFYADPSVFQLGWTGVIRLVAALMDANGNPSAECDIRSTSNPVLFGVRAVGDDARIARYK